MMYAGHKESIYTGMPANGTSNWEEDVCELVKRENRPWLLIVDNVVNATLLAFLAFLDGSF